MIIAEFIVGFCAGSHILLEFSAFTLDQKNFMLIRKVCEVKTLCSV